MLLVYQFFEIIEVKHTRKFVIGNSTRNSLPSTNRYFLEQKNIFFRILRLSIALK
jgi:hypothetical protein